MTEVTVFPTCLVEMVRPAAGAATVRVLERRGHDVIVAKGTCCGQPAWNSGFTGAARRVARRTLKALRRTSGPIVVPSGSCATMMHAAWPELFAGTRDEADVRAVAARVREFADFAAESAGATTPATGMVAYHDSCHMLRELGVKDQPRRLLGECGVQVAEVEGAERCCGFGGTFSVKLPEVSVAMADEKLDEFAATGTGRLVGCDVSCLMHLGGRARQRGMDIEVAHLAEVIEQAE
jgi:L-lactate dehydrogenase complex protein LldE